MSSTKEEKDTLRERVLTERKQLPEEEWKERSASIIQKLTDTDFYREAEVVHTYVSMNERGEVNTDELIEQLFESEKKVVVPITNFSDHTLTHVELQNFGELISNKWGVREPESEEKLVEVDQLDLIIIPMAAVDRAGNRLGYGKGYYDRFLEEASGLKVGLVFSDFFFDEVPAEHFDVKMDVIITENEVYYP